MTRPDALPDLTHRWQIAQHLITGRGPVWECRDCLTASDTAFIALCDERIRAWGCEQYHNGVRDAFAGRVALAANEADPTGRLIVVPVERMDDLAAPTPTPHEG